MKALVEKMGEKNLIFKSLESVLAKELGSRKKVALYVGVDLKGYYCLIMKLVKKSRVLRKEAIELMVLHEKMEKLKDTKIIKKYIWIDAPLCSKAKALMEEHGWKVWHHG
jgi:hypothetical protein